MGKTFTKKHRNKFICSLLQNTNENTVEEQLQDPKKSGRIHLEDTKNEKRLDGETMKDIAGVSSDETLQLLQNSNGINLQDTHTRDIDGNAVRDIPGVSSICVVDFDEEVTPCVYNFNAGKNVTPTGVVVIPSMVSVRINMFM